MSNIREFVIDEKTAQLEKKQSEIKKSKKSNYKKWNAFKEMYLDFINFLSQKGDIEKYYCRKCQKDYKVKEIIIYDLMMGFTIEGLNQKEEKIEKLIVDICRECNYLSDVNNPYISNSVYTELVCLKCKTQINKNDKYLKILNEIFCSRECVKNFLNEKSE